MLKKKLVAIDINVEQTTAFVHVDTPSLFSSMIFRAKFVPAGASFVYRDSDQVLNAP